MAAIIDSAPDCVTRNEGGENFAEDGADFILQDNYADCAGFGTFMPGSTYGEEGAGAESIYMIVTWMGIALTIAALVAWVIYENRQLVRHVARLGGARTEPPSDIPPQPGGVGDAR
jgi:hypothetical protein